jgi:hypothetical protein
MFSNAELHLAYKVANAPISGFPYPHCYVRDVFPAGFYDDMQRHMPDPEAMIPIEEARQVKGYKERFVLELSSENLNTLPKEKKEFWADFANWLLAGRFQQVLMSKFAPALDARFRGMQGIKFYNEALLVQDITDYKLGPHSDSPVKVLSLLFYLPKDDAQAHLGTSIYVPKDINFRCPGGPYYPFDQFTRMVTMPFLPNSLFMFVKGDRSFHGVEPVGDPGTRRWLLLFDIFMEPAAQSASPFQQGWRATVTPVGAGVQPAAPQPATPGPATPGPKFSF